MSNVATTPAKAKPAAPATASTAGSSGLSLFQDYPHFLSRMQEEFNRLFERFHRDWPLPLSDLGLAKNWRWGVDVQDQDHAYVVRAEAPGFEPSDFDLQVTGNRLVLKASHRAETKGKKGEPQEWHEQEYYQSVTLPGGIDREMAAAEYKNGILTVTLPKNEEAKSKKLTVMKG